MTAFGMPIWYELLTPDVEASTRFYGDIVGWTTCAAPTSAGEIDYRIWQAETPAETGVGGLLTPPSGCGDMAGWLIYFHVADVDAAVSTTEAHGGGVLMPPTDVPAVGRIALLRDAQGAPFYVMTPDASMSGQESTAFSERLPQRACWNELVATDEKAALSFYRTLFGWTTDEAMPMGAMGDYRFIDAGGTRIGAAMNRSRPEQPIRWTPYFRVPDADAAAEKVRAGGGTVLAGPMDVPGGQRVIVTLDPQGLAVGFVSAEWA